MASLFKPTNTTAIQYAVPLLSQQLWCIGQDILRPEGNWLIELGFERFAPPKQYAANPSVYKRELTDGRCVLLRGFGVLFSDPQLGSVVLPRYEFMPRYCQRAKLDRLPWTRDDLPQMRIPSLSQRQACTQLVSGCLNWIADYETKIVEELGIGYRSASLDGWETNNHDVIPAKEMAPAWRALSAWMASNSNTLYQPQGCGGRLPASAGKRSSRRHVVTKKRRAAIPFVFNLPPRARSVRYP